MRSLARLLLALSLPFAPACGKGDPVQETCELLLSCDCSSVSYPDAATCVTAFNEQLDGLRSQAAAQGLKFADDCVDSTLSVYTDSIECSNEYKAPRTCSPCAMMHGDKAVGAACTEHDGGSDCAKDLYCSGGTCIDPCERLAAGSACAVEKDGVVDSTGICDEDLYCDHAGTLTCTPVIAAGGACPDLSGCASDLFCNAELVCQAVPREGEACEFFCQANLACEDGVCKPGPGEGEPCPAAGDCGPGTRCDYEASVCVVDDPLVCQLGEP